MVDVVVVVVVLQVQTLRVSSGMHSLCLMRTRRENFMKNSQFCIIIISYKSACIIFIVTRYNKLYSGQMDDDVDDMMMNYMPFGTCLLSQIIPSSNDDAL